MSKQRKKIEHIPQRGGFRVEAIPCPCGRCGKLLVTPLFDAVESCLIPLHALELVRRWNHFEEHGG